MFKSLRKAKGFTQVKLAEELGLDQSTISSWETNVSTPSISTMRKIAEVFDCNLLDVVDCFDCKEEAK